MDYSQKPTDLLFVPSKETIMSRKDIAYALKKAWANVFNEEITKNQLGILFSQACLETGNGEKMFNFNFGNVKRVAGKPYTSYKCSEILNGKNEVFVPYHPQTFFKAHSSMIEGAEEYILHLTTPRYAKALAALKSENVVGYIHECKLAGYFTADEYQYTKTVVSINKSFQAKKEEYWNWVPVGETNIEEMIEEIVITEPVKVTPPPLPEIVQSPIVPVSINENANNKIKTIWEFLFLLVQNIIKFFGKK